MTYLESKKVGWPEFSHVQQMWEQVSSKSKRTVWLIMVGRKNTKRDLGNNKIKAAVEKKVAP